MEATNQTSRYEIIDRCDNFYDVRDTETGRTVIHRTAFRPSHEECMEAIGRQSTPIAA